MAKKPKIPKPPAPAASVVMRWCLGVIEPPHRFPSTHAGHRRCARCESRVKGLNLSAREAEARTSLTGDEQRAATSE